MAIMHCQLIMEDAVIVAMKQLTEKNSSKIKRQAYNIKNNCKENKNANKDI